MYCTATHILNGLVIPMAAIKGLISNRDISNACDVSTQSVYQWGYDPRDQSPVDYPHVPAQYNAVILELAAEKKVNLLKAIDQWKREL